MNDRQRILVVVALGLALAVVAGTWIAMLHADRGGGWFAYAPGTAPIYPGQPADAFGDGVIAFTAVCIWATISYRLLRSRKDTQPRDEQHTTAVWRSTVGSVPDAEQPLTPEQQDAIRRSVDELLGETPTELVEEVPEVRHPDGGDESARRAREIYYGSA